jgi:hypothetical protein
MPGCGARKRLQVHHIRRWVDAPALRYAVNNGVTLCRKCHRRLANDEQAFEALFATILGGEASLLAIWARYRDVQGDSG